MSSYDPNHIKIPPYPIGPIDRTEEKLKAHFKNIEEYNATVKAHNAYQTECQFKDAGVLPEDIPAIKELCDHDDWIGSVELACCAYVLGRKSAK